MNTPSRDSSAPTNGAADPVSDSVSDRLAETGPLANPTPAPPRLPRYEVRRLLGVGGMGAVYLAHDKALDRPVALKVPQFAVGDTSAHERFTREARSAASLNHPGICPVYDVGEADGVPYLAMAYVEGKPLNDLLKAARSAVPPRSAATLARFIALAMHAAHVAGIVHRDLKPANVMITPKRRPVVMDFGLARRAFGDSSGRRLTLPGTYIGTPSYMPPEQVNGEADEIGPGTDIYALGVILFECLTGRLPFEGAQGWVMAQIVSQAPPRPSSLRIGLPPELDLICLRCLEKRPRDRYASMLDLAADLEQYLTLTAPSPSNPAMPKPSPSSTALGQHPMPSGGAPTSASKVLMELPQGPQPGDELWTYRGRTTGGPDTTAPASDAAAALNNRVWIGLGAMGVALMLTVLGLAMLNGGDQRQATPQPAATKPG